MPIDYGTSTKVFELSFQRLSKPSAPLGFPPRASLSTAIAPLLKNTKLSTQFVSHSVSPLFASASVEMWHRAIHSFLCSVSLSESSPLWASVTGYYASHFIMRAFAHGFGFFKSFSAKAIAQIVINNGKFVCGEISDGERGEHNFYWKVVKQHPDFIQNPLFRSNSERDEKSDCAHRNFANYTDHIGSFTVLKFMEDEEVAKAIEKISHIRRFSVTEPSRDSFPDLVNVQILAYQRIVTYREYLDAKLANNRFWKAHRDPSWAKTFLNYQLDDTAPEPILN